MKKQLLDILACPVCKGKLELRIDKEENGEVIYGSLYCRKGNVTYPVEDGIPDLLPPAKHA